eukprot:scaffold79908_cov38-Prasinocladus_malaysianus.AAC.1
MGGNYSKPKDVPSRLFPKEVEDLPSMEGRVVAITGCTTGTGFIAAKTIAQKGGEVVMLNRVSERAASAENAVKEAVPDAKVCTIGCDLQSLESVQQAIKSLKEKYSDGID